MIKLKAEEVIRLHKLEPLTIEGGYFREIYKSDFMVNTDFGPRSAYTHIYYLLKRNQISKLHRLKSDEIWNFYAGDPVIIIDISPEGTLKKVTLGPMFPTEKSEYRFVKGHWFGAYLNDESDWSFFGCSVSPGFEYADFELGNRKHLVEQYPDLEDYIIKLT